MSRVLHAHEEKKGRVRESPCRQMWEMGLGRSHGGWEARLVAYRSTARLVGDLEHRAEVPSIAHQDDRVIVSCDDGGGSGTI